MCTPAVHHRLPRAGVDAIDCAETALLTLAMAIQQPLRAETVTLLLDDQRRGHRRRRRVGHAPARRRARGRRVLHAQRRPRRPGRAASSSPACGPSRTTRPTTATDVDRWLEMSDIAEQAGVELIEWFVIGGDVTCPRDRLGEPPRW